MSDLFSSRYAEIVVRLSTVLQSTIEEVRASGSVGLYSSGTPTETMKTYTARVYTTLNLPLSKPPKDSVAQTNQPEMFAGLPLAGVEQVTVRWARYQEYLALFLDGEKDPFHLAKRLFEAL